MVGFYIDEIRLQWFVQAKVVFIGIEKVEEC